MNLKNLQKGFTLVELLVVVGIISILAVAALVAINPAEAQRKARDAKRLKDMVTLQSVLMQWYGDGNRPSKDMIVNSRQDSSNKSCTTSGWLDIDVCNYIQQLPVDPSNKLGTHIKANGARGRAYLRYEVRLNQYNTFAIRTLFESERNLDTLKNDGGTAGDWFEVNPDGLSWTLQK